MFGRVATFVILAGGDKREVNRIWGKWRKLFVEKGESTSSTEIRPHERLFMTLKAHCPIHLKQIVQVAYHTGMRQGEILSLTWGQVDLKEGFIKLRPEDTKTNDGRLVPLNGELMEMFRALPHGLPAVPVFTYKGKSISCIKKSFVTACKKAGVEDFTFHDLRHVFINNRRLEGHDYFRIMAATGHKTLEVFKRYNSVSKDELKALVER